MLASRLLMHLSQMKPFIARTAFCLMETYFKLFFFFFFFFRAVFIILDIFALLSWSRSWNALPKISMQPLPQFRAKTVNQCPEYALPRCKIWTMFLSVVWNVWCFAWKLLVGNRLFAATVSNGFSWLIVLRFQLLHINLFTIVFIHFLL